MTVKSQIPSQAPQRQPAAAPGEKAQPASGEAFVDNRPASIAQRKLIETISGRTQAAAVPVAQMALSKEVAQLKTDIRLTTDVYGYNDGSDKQEHVGQEMLAYLDPADQKNGSQPGSSVQSGLMGYLKSLSYKRMVRGHLLNEQLGGLGIAANLYPITTQANGKHKNHVEGKVKKYIEKEPSNGSGRRLMYKVTVNKQSSWKPNKPDVNFTCLVQWENGSSLLVDEEISSNPVAGKTGTGAATKGTDTLSYKNKDLPKGWGGVGKGFSSSNSAHVKTQGVTTINGTPASDLNLDTSSFTEGKIDLENFLTAATEFISDLPVDDDEIDEYLQMVDDAESNPSANMQKLVDILKLCEFDFNF